MSPKNIEPESDKRRVDPAWLHGEPDPTKHPSKKPTESTAKGALEAFQIIVNHISPEVVGYSE